MEENLIYKIKKDKHDVNSLKMILNKYKEIKFISLMGVDLFGNVTDVRIPINIFLKDLEKFLHKFVVQIDGSSLDFSEIVTTDDAKVDMLIDLDCDWFIDYNNGLFDEKNSLPVGTLIIPVFLYHNGNAIDSRSILKQVELKTKEEILNLIKKDNECFKNYDICCEEIEKIFYTVATELEFWVQTSNEKIEREELLLLQKIKGQYWSKINGNIRNAIEECLIVMEKYELEPEMGHKESGRTRRLSACGEAEYIMEQIEIDWKYSNPIQAADNQIFVKELVRKIFAKYGLETMFKAKPVENVAGSGMHVHFGIYAQKKDSKKINLLNSNENTYLSTIGYGALMGILKNYKIINPFISPTEDSLKRLKPGYEAPVCNVTSLGKEINKLSRNRSILISMIKENKNLLSTRFELRSPNPSSNIYITIAVSYLSMIDGIRYATKNNKTEKMLLQEINKEQGEYYGYLEKNRIYRSEENVFEYYTKEERDKLFGESPNTVWENMRNLNNKKEIEILKYENIFTDLVIESFKKCALEKWKLIICKRKIKEYFNEMSSWKKKNSIYAEDINNWKMIEEKMQYIYKTTANQKSLFYRVHNAFEKNEWDNASRLVIELEEKMEELRYLYISYKNNIIEN